MISPRGNSEITVKQPNIQAVFTEPVDLNSLIIMLDDTDITVTAEITEKGFHCRPPVILSAGEHLLYIAGNSDNGPFEQEIHFVSRQYRFVDEASTTNEWTMNIQAGTFHGNHSNDYTFSSLDSTLQHESVVKKGNRLLSLSGNVRLLEQKRPSVPDNTGNNFFPDQSNAYGPQEISSDGQAQNQGSIDPEQQGLDLNTILMHGQYQQNNLKSFFEVGDLQVVASKNTFGFLARNGGQLNIDYHNFYLNGFSVFGKDTFGLHDGFGIGFDNDEHLNGFSGGIRVLDQRVDLKGFYLDGGQKENSYSSWSQEQGNSGSVYGLVLATRFFNDLLTTEFEYDRSDFDPDIFDEFGGKSDEAWRLQIGGRRDLYSYDISYERFGPNYDLAGNLSPKKDYEGISANGSMQYGVHSIGLMLSGYHDNVDDNPAYARTDSYTGLFDYSYAGFMNFPLGVSYQHTGDLSTDEPEDNLETNLTTDSININAAYAGQGIFGLDTMTSYSWQNDDSYQDADIATLSFAVSPILNFETFSLTMSGTLNQNRDLLSDNRTDDYVLTLDIMGFLFDELVSYELGGTYDRTLFTDDSSDRHGFTGYSRINYHLDRLLEYGYPTIGLEVQYNSDTPRGDTTTEDIRVFSTLSTSVPFSF